MDNQKSVLFSVDAKYDALDTLFVSIFFHCIQSVEKYKDTFENFLN